MKWTKTDRTECRTDITELTLHDEYNEPQGTIQIATKDADTILNWLNELWEIRK